MKKLKRMNKYWICDACVKEKHKDWETAYPTGGNTVTSGLCGHCESEVETFLTPVCDYKRPGKSVIWD